MMSSALVTSCLALVLTVNPLVANPAFIYHNFEQLTQFLEETHRKFPDITRLSSIGKSVEGRDLWVLTLSTQPDKHVLLQPELQYIGNMHGNEAVGRELLIHLIDYLTSQYGERDDVTTLLRTSRVHILVSMNPDGFELAQRDGKEGKCTGLHGRMNANNYDLNRNFPDYFQSNPYPLQPETLAVMDWLKDVQFTLAANLHGGALVVVYPYDNYFVGSDCPESLYCYRAKLNRTDCSCHCNEDDLSAGKTCPIQSKLGPYKGHAYSKSSDDDVFRHISLTYAKKHPTIAGAVCGRNNYPADGVMNGASWYVIRGGMQGYAYVYAGLKEVTLEVSCCKFPNRTELPMFWEHNREPLIAFLLEGHRGVKGIVSGSEDNQPIKGASVEVVGKDHPTNTTEFGEFWRTLLPGTYTIKVTAVNYAGVSLSFTVNDGNATVLYLTLDKNITAPVPDPSTTASTDASTPGTTARVTSPQTSPQTSTHTEELPESSETTAFTARPPVTSSRPPVTSSAVKSTSDNPPNSSSQPVTSSTGAISDTMSPPTHPPNVDPYVTSENESNSSTLSPVTSSRRPRTNDDRSGRDGSSSASQPARFSLLVTFLGCLGLTVRHIVPLRIY